ncbi:MAG: radical SAM protein [Patescibacteria group bacterium]|nr:radical SAM protein [Patescibacteria group bacterium]MDD4304173.1 radical SAM protein [Patescibacteria group bacterium]MDD4695205.1 radical SAM protein [Patescibacteria group bacterium]
MLIKQITAKSIITKSGLPGADFVINPYTGCGHGCIYCYARFMKKFTNHSEEWGEFVDVKINAPEIIKKEIKKICNKIIVIGSVTDPYQEAEKEFEITKKILENIKDVNAHFNILTKSDLILRDLELLKQFKNIEVVISMCSSDENIKKFFEKNSPKIENRINTLEKSHKNNIKTILFVSPILPEITNWKEIINITKNFVDEYWFENLNLYPSIQNNIFKVLENKFPSLVSKYKEIYFTKNDYFINLEKDIKLYCMENKIKHKIYFHHKKII